MWLQALFLRFGIFLQIGSARIVSYRIHNLPTIKFNVSLISVRYLHPIET